MITLIEVKDIIKETFKERGEEYGYITTVELDEFYLQKDLGKVRYKLLFGAYYEQKKDKVYAGGFTPEIRFNELEDLVGPLFIKYKILGSRVKVQHLTTIQPDLLNENHDFNMEISEEADLELFKNRLFSNFKNNYEILFEPYQDLRPLYEQVKATRSIEDRFDLLGQLALYKYPVILRLFGDPEYYKDMEEAIEEVESLIKKDPDNQDYITDYKMTYELKEILDQTPPAYDL